MQIFKTVLFATATIVFGSRAFAAEPLPPLSHQPQAITAPTSPPPQVQKARKDGQGKKNKLKLTHEQKLILKVELKEQFKGLPKEQRKAKMREMRHQFAGMGSQQQQQKIGELNQEWNSMPADKKQKFLDKAQKKQAKKDKSGKKHGKNKKKNKDKSGKIQG